MAAQAADDGARPAHYVGDEYYAALAAQFTGWTREELALEDAAPRERVASLLYREARLLDLGQYEEWLGLCAPECLYWVPGAPGGGDPRREIAIAFDDRRRLEDRIYRLRTGYAWSQVPPSRTARLLANLEVFRTAQASVLMTRSVFTLHEFRAGDARILAGWTAHRLVELDGRWRIAVKQVNLIDCDQNMRYPSIVL